jgi:hypothetical protein
MALDAAVVDPAAAAAAAAAAPVPAGASGKAKGKASKSGKHTAGGNQLSRPRKPLEATLLDLKTNRHMLRLMPPLSAAAAAAANTGDQAGDQAAAAAAAAGDRAAAAALAPARQWGSSSSSSSVMGIGGMHGSVQGFAGNSSSRDQQAVVDPEAAAAAEALQIKHVPELLSQEFRPVLPDGDDWLADIVWDRDEAAAAVDEAAAAADEQGVISQQQQLEKQVSNVDKLSKASQQQQQQQLMNNSGQAMRLGSGRAADGVLGRRVRVVWDLNDPLMVFEAAKSSQYSNASAVVQQAAPKVRVVRRDELLWCLDVQFVVHICARRGFAMLCLFKVPMPPLLQQA